jgi:hypothetical protein
LRSNKKETLAFHVLKAIFGKLMQKPPEVVLFQQQLQLAMLISVYLVPLIYSLVIHVVKDTSAVQIKKLALPV